MFVCATRRGKFNLYPNMDTPVPALNWWTNMAPWASLSGPESVAPSELGYVAKRRGCESIEFQSSRPVQELDKALGLTEMSADNLQDSRLGQNKQHGLIPLLRQSVYSRLAGYEDVNDAERLSVDPAMRRVVGGRAALGWRQSSAGGQTG